MKCSDVHLGQTQSTVSLSSPCDASDKRVKSLKEEPIIHKEGPSQGLQTFAEPSNTDVRLTLIILGKKAH